MGNGADNPLSEEEAVAKADLFAMDPTQVCGVVANTEQAKRLICRFVDHDTLARMPTLTFKTDEEIKSKFGLDYVTKILAVLDVLSDSVTIETARNFPVKLSDSEGHFSFILAPRVNE